MNEKLNNAIGLLKTCLTEAKNPHVLFWADQRSVLCIYLLHKYALSMPPMLLIDTNQIFEEVYFFVQKLKKLWNLEIIQKSYEDEYNSLTEKPGSIECCMLRKANVLRKAISDLDIDLIITGIKPDVFRLQWDPNLEIDSGDHRAFNPVFHFSDDEIIILTKDLNLPYCSLWAKGLLEPDCKTCTKLPESISQLNDSAGDKQQVMQRLKSLGYC